MRDCDRSAGDQLEVKVNIVVRSPRNNRTSDYTQHYLNKEVRRIGKELGVQTSLLSSYVEVTDGIGARLAVKYYDGTGTERTYCVAL